MKFFVKLQWGKLSVKTWFKNENFKSCKLNEKTKQTTDHQSKSPIQEKLSI